MNEYKHFGVMIDCSRNAVMKPSEVKKFIDLLAKMGYNTIELYTEDTYEVKDEPYFGYLRGAYTAEEIKDIDAYAKSKGMELIPCIQTLAHFTNTVKLPVYREIVDIDDILLIDEEKTYVFVENLIKTVAENFTSRNLHIGMDEAHLVGLGKYLDRHGYQNRFEILLRHLNRVVKIAEKYGFTVQMWSDMFFRLQNHDEYYKFDTPIGEEVVKLIPEGLEPVYWDYYHQDIEMYDGMIAAHKALGKKCWFAGGAWTWGGFVPNNRFSLATMRPAMESVRKNGIEDVFITMWGDDGKECSFYTVLPALYAIRSYALGIFDEAKIKEGFFETFGVKFDDFLLLDIPNHSKKSGEGTDIDNPVKSLLYNDCFMGVYDPNLEKEGVLDFASRAEKLEAAAKNAGEYAYLFKNLANLCKVLAVKGDLGLRTRKAYRAKDTAALKALVKDYRKTEKLLEEFYQGFKALWFKENKEFGWEIQEARLGGLMLRVRSCGDRLEEYLKGKSAQIDELEKDLLELDPNFGGYCYRGIVSTSNL